MISRHLGGQIKLVGVSRWAKGILTSLRKIRSLTTPMILLIVSPKSPPLIGSAKSMVEPSRSSPLERSWLLMYSDAVLRLSVSAMAVSWSA